MARGRMLNKSISLSEKFASMPDDTCRMVATWCIAHLDKNGVFYADPKFVNKVAFPFLDKPDNVIRDAINAMAHVGIIKLFEVSGKFWQLWPTFMDNQKGLHVDRERTDFPEPPGESGQYCRKLPEVSGSLRNVEDESNLIQSNPTQLVATATRAPEFHEQQAIPETTTFEKKVPEMNLADLDSLTLAHASKSASEKAIGKQRCSDNAKSLMLAFYEVSGIPFTSSWTKPANDMDGVGVRDADVKAAYKKLVADHLNVVGLYSVMKTAIALHVSTNGKDKPQTEDKFDFVTVNNNGYDEMKRVPKDNK